MPEERATNCQWMSDYMREACTASKGTVDSINHARWLVIKMFLITVNFNYFLSDRLS